MQTEISNIIEKINKSEIEFLVLDMSGYDIRILIEPTNKKSFEAFAKKSKWRKKKDKSGDLYLYGMEHFLYYKIGEVNLVVCCQIACRSTLNGEWVPLDRMVNIGAMSRKISSENKVNILCAEDEVCYLLAKCVYTKKVFEDGDIERIKKAFADSDKNIMSAKLTMVFFRFTPTMIEMISEGKYSELIDGLWRFAEY